MAHFSEGYLDRVKEVYKRGLRHRQLLHELDGMVSPLGDTNTTPAHLGGLTALGAEVVKECRSWLDLACASHESVGGHAAANCVPHQSRQPNRREGWWKSMKPRLISKDYGKVVADAGGVVGRVD